MRIKDLPKMIKSPITGDELLLKNKKDHNNENLSVAQFFDTCTEWVDDVVMYRNDITNEIIYISIEN